MKMEQPFTWSSGSRYAPRVQPTGTPASSAKSKYAGMRCIALREDGTVCNAIISSYTILPCQFCTPCHGRYMRRGLPLPIVSKQGKKKKPASEKAADE